MWWMDILTFLYNYNQLWQLTVNDFTRLTPFLTGPWASSLPLWRMRNDQSLLTYWTPLWLPHEESLATEISWTKLTSRRNECRSPSQMVRLLLCIISRKENVITEPLLIMNVHSIIYYSGFQVVYTEPLPSNCHIPSQYDPAIASYPEKQASLPYTSLH
jgi:hypothetical protein